MKKFAFLLVAALMLCTGITLYVADVVPVAVVPLSLAAGLVTLSIAVPGFKSALLNSGLIVGVVGAGMFGSALHYEFGVNVLLASAAVLLVCFRFGSPPEHAAVKNAGLQREIWLAMLVAPFGKVKPWLNRIEDFGKKVVPVGDEGAVINYAEIGVDPTVLINNTTYPISVLSRTDTPKNVSLDKFDTTNTSISEDELIGLSYDKMASVIDRHGVKLAEKQGEKAAHALGVQTNTSTTPIVKTTGTARPDMSTRKAAKIQDVINLAKAMNLAGFPQYGRILLLHPYHAADLQVESITLYNQFVDAKEGQPVRFQGFDMYVDNDTAVYNSSEAKKTFGAAAAPSTDRISSTAYINEHAWRATGNKQVFSALASGDPENRRSVIGFREFFICTMKTTTGHAALIDDVVV